MEIKDVAKMVGGRLPRKFPVYVNPDEGVINVVGMQEVYPKSDMMLCEISEACRLSEHGFSIKSYVLGTAIPDSWIRVLY